MKISYDIIGSRLKDARKSKNITQQALSEELNISISFLSRVERGLSHFNLERILQTCYILEVPVSYILEGTCSKDENYLEQDFSNLLKSCSPEKQKLIYDVAKTIAESK